MEKLRIKLIEIVKRLEIATTKLATTGITGNYKSVFKGKGLEFEDYRVYTPNDDANLIDWKASLRAQELLIKEFVEERNLNIFFLVDASSSMVNGTTEKLKNEYAAEVVASLSLAMLNSDDYVGLALFTDRIVKTIVPEKGKEQLYLILSTLANPYYYGGNYDLNAALRFTLEYLSYGTILCIVSDFIGLKNDFEKVLKIASQKFDIVAFMVRDPIDRDLPEDPHPVILSDTFSNKSIIIIPSKIRAYYKRYVEQQELLIKEIFLRNNCGFISLSTNKPFILPIIKYFEERKSRLR